MPGEQFCLRWNNYHPNLISVFSSLLQNDQMVDVTIISDDHEIHAHKIVLSACSEFFQNIFLKNDCKHPVIVLVDVKFEHLRSLIDFIYNGRVNIYEEHLPELLRIANILKIKGLVSDVSPVETPNESFDSEEDQQSPFDVAQPNNAIGDSSLTGSLPIHETKAGDADEIKTEQTEQTKLSKKRKSVSFSDIPEIVQNEMDPDYMPRNIKVSNNRKPKLRSSTETCTITKLCQPSNADSFESDSGIEPKSELLVSEVCSISILPTANQIEPSHEANVTTKKPRTVTSRKMIRKNENFLRALEAVRTQGIGFCKAAKLHGVNNRTLWLEYQKLGYPIKNARKKSNT